MDLLAFLFVIGYIVTIISIGWITFSVIVVIWQTIGDLSKYIIKYRRYKKGKRKEKSDLE